MPTKKATVEKREPARCPACGKPIYLRMNGTGRCNKCGFDGPMSSETKGGK